jgi:uncharacterized membrane protein
MNKENAARDYIRQVKAIFPLYGRERKRFINDLKEAVESHIEDTKDGSYEGIVKHFGSPAEVVSDYIEGMDPEALYRKITFRRRILTIAGIVLIAVLVGVIFNLYWNYDAYRQSVESIVVEGETIIY